MRNPRTTGQALAAKEAFSKAMARHPFSGQLAQCQRRHERSAALLKFSEPGRAARARGISRATSEFERRSRDGLRLRVLEGKSMSDDLGHKDLGPVMLDIADWN